jgi:hypothetical protein
MQCKSKNCCNGDCNQGRNCPARAPLSLKDVKQWIWNNLYYPPLGFTLSEWALGVFMIVILLSVVFK